MKKFKREYYNFKCPQCGSGRWGTHNLDDHPKKWIGSCHGDNCDFEWPRTQDHLYFQEFVIKNPVTIQPSA